MRSEIGYYGLNAILRMCADSNKKMKSKHFFFFRLLRERNCSLEDVILIYKITKTNMSKFEYIFWRLDYSLRYLQFGDGLYTCDSNLEHIRRIVG